MIDSLVVPKSFMGCRGYSRSRNLSWDVECLNMKERHCGLVIAVDAYHYPGSAITIEKRDAKSFLVVWSIPNDEKGPQRQEWAWHGEEQIEKVL